MMESQSLVCADMGLLELNVLCCGLGLGIRICCSRGDFRVTDDQENVAYLRFYTRRPTLKKLGTLFGTLFRTFSCPEIENADFRTFFRTHFRTPIQHTRRLLERFLVKKLRTVYAVLSTILTKSVPPKRYSRTRVVHHGHFHVVRKLRVG
jgi:hypothetical protein